MNDSIAIFEAYQDDKLTVFRTTDKDYTKDWDTITGNSNFTEIRSIDEDYSGRTPNPVKIYKLPIKFVVDKLKSLGAVVKYHTFENMIEIHQWQIWRDFNNWLDSDQPAKDLAKEKSMNQNPEVKSLYDL